MFKKIFNWVCGPKQLTVAIDCENISHRKLPALVNQINRLQYNNVEYLCYINPNCTNTSKGRLGNLLADNGIKYQGRLRTLIESSDCFVIDEQLNIYLVEDYGE